MKKIIALLLALSVLFALTACGGDNENTPTGESTGATTSTTESTTNATDGAEDSTQDTTEGTTGGDATDSTTPPTTTPPTTTPPTTETPNKTNDTTAPVITALSIAQQGQTLKAGDTLTLNLSITEESDISTCQIVFRNETTGATINAHGSFKHRADGKYSYTYRITDDMSSGKWVFSSTFVGDKYSMYGNDTISNKSNVFFYVENASSDTTAPVITALSIAQQGQTLKAGDTLTLNLSITEESDISTCQIVFRNETTGATINAHGSFKHRADGKYSYTYRITDDMSSGKWVFSSTFIGDKYSMYGNDTISNKSNVFFYVQ